MSGFPNIDELPITPRIRALLRYGDVNGDYRYSSNRVTMAIATGFAVKRVPLEVVIQCLDDPANLGGAWTRGMKAAGQAAKLDDIVQSAYRYGCERSAS